MTPSDDDRRRQRGCLEDLGCAGLGCLPWLLGVAVAIAAANRRQQR